MDFNVTSPGFFLLPESGRPRLGLAECVHYLGSSDGCDGFIDVGRVVYAIAGAGIDGIIRSVGIDLGRPVDFTPARPDV